MINEFMRQGKKWSDNTIFVPVALLGDYSRKTIFEDEEFLSLDQSIFSFLVVLLEDDQRLDQGMQN